MKRRTGGHDNVIKRLGLDRSMPTKRNDALSPGSAPSSRGLQARHQLPASATGPRHCWVVDAPECPGRWPGILLGWEQGGKGWLGRVMVAVEGREGMVSMTLWVRADYLRPAQTTTEP